MFRVEGLACGHGGRPLLTGIDFEVGRGEMLVVLGPNGAGKTTMLSTFVGLLPALAGRLSVDRADVTGIDAVRRAREHGIAWVPEGRRLFNGLSVYDNLVLGCYRARTDERRRRIDEVFDVFPKLAVLRSRDVANLSGGEQQMVAIGRALAMRPRVLLLDEPSLGLAPLMVDTIFESLVQRLSDLAVVLVEQNVEIGLHHGTSAIVLEGGGIALRGAADEMRRNAAVQQAYFAGAPA